MNEEDDGAENVVIFPVDRIQRIVPEPDNVHPQFREEARRAKTDMEIGEIEQHAQKVVDPEMTYLIRMIKTSHAKLLEKDVEAADKVAVWCADQVDIYIKALYTPED